MNCKRGWMGAMAALFAAMPMTVWAQTVPIGESVTPPKAEQAKPKLTEAQKKELNKKLDAKVKEMESLKSKATTVTKGIGELAASGKLPTSDEAIALMKSMVQEMQQIREALQKVVEEVEGIKGWIEGQNEALPIMANDILDLKKNKQGTYIQTQYRDTDQKGGASDAFSTRRMRIGSTQTVDSKTQLKWSFDISTGTNTTVAQMRDAFVIYDVEPSLEKVGTQITMGQHALPLGYELERSSSEREFPERAIYNQRMFNGERSRGINIKHGISNNSYVHIGGWDALSFNDAEQSARAAGPESRLAMSGGIRTYGANYDLGVAAFFGERPTFTTGSGTSAIMHPRVDREFFYADATYVGLIVPELFIRAEGMIGKDRLPVTGTPTSARTRKDMAGYQVQVGYNVNYKNQINFRFESFDPDRDTDKNAIRGYGVAWIHYLNPGARITAAHEIFEDPSRAGAGVRQQRYQATTLRVQFKF